MFTKADPERETPEAEGEKAETVGKSPLGIYPAAAAIAAAYLVTIGGKSKRRKK